MTNAELIELFLGWDSGNAPNPDLVSEQCNLVQLARGILEGKYFVISKERLESIRDELKKNSSEEKNSLYDK